MNKKRIAWIVSGIVFVILIASVATVSQQSLYLPSSVEYRAVALAPEEFRAARVESFPAFGIGGGAPMPDTTTNEDVQVLAYARARSVNSDSVERVVIQNADVAIVVSDVEKRMKEIEDLAKAMGGYVVSSNLYQSYTQNYVEVPEATIVVRVPSNQLSEALEAVKKDAVEVLSENRSGTDVTDQYVDLQARLKAKKAAEAKLLEIMEGAQTTEDVLSVYQQLQSIQTEIESLTGQINYIEQSAALAALSVRLVAEETIQPVKVGPWEPKGVALEAVQDLINFSKGFAEFLIRFVVFTLPSWIMVGIPLYLLFLGGRALYRRIRKNQPKKETAPDEGERKT